MEKEMCQTHITSMVSIKQQQGRLQDYNNFQKKVYNSRGVGNLTRCKEI